MRVWFGGIRERIEAFGFDVVDQVMLPKHWRWTDYYAPLEARIRAFREDHGQAAAPAELARHEREIAVVKANPGRFDGGFFIVKKAARRIHPPRRASAS
jgi:hypothetical protein